MKPSICAVLIARNEERDLPRMLRSILGVAERAILVDTGSTDRTLEVASIAKIDAVTYLDASEPNPDKPGEWRLVNFSKARNHAIELGEATGCSHILWMDADDEIITPLAIRRAAYMPDAVYGVFIELGGGIRQVHYRLFPAKYRIRFSGWIHEWPNISGKPQVVLNDAMIRHDATPHASAGEDSNQRNLRILTAQYAAEPDARTAFYLANTHKDAGRWTKAAEWYQKRMGYGAAFREEYLFAVLYLARCLTNAQDYDRAYAACITALAEAPDWQEMRMALAFVHYQRQEYEQAIVEATKALDRPIPPTVLWREPQMYRDQPARLISWCHEHQGRLSEALQWSRVATTLIGAHDAEWNLRERVLEQRVRSEPPAIVKGLRRKIALHRPGAIGDILMTLNLLPAFKEANPDTDVHYFCHAGLAAPDALGSIIQQAGADMVLDCAALPAWRGQYERVIDLVGYPLSEGYPEKPMRHHLLEYFAHEMGVHNIEGEPAMMVPVSGPPPWLPSLTLRRPKAPTEMDGPYITMQTRAGWSKYKQWSENKWNAVQSAMPGVAFVWLDETSGWTLSQSIAMFANATMHMGIDSWCNHATNYYWTDENGGRRVPGVILWGSTQASAAGYPGNVNISKGLACQPCFRENPAISRQPRGPCINPPRASYDDNTPRACMEQITVDEVVEAVRTMWAQASSMALI